MESEATSQGAINDLTNLIAQLRDPRQGCPWDLEQTHDSLIPYVLEEAHEVADAIRNGNTENLKEELGDLLLQVLLHAQIANEEGRFNLEDIAYNLQEKLIRRHPHVFNRKKEKGSNVKNINWDSIKRKEKDLAPSETPISDELRDKVRPQPAIAGALLISKKAANSGFEWESLEEVWEKVEEEIKELKEAISRNEKLHAQEELGDILFTIINIARWCKLNPEEGLTGTNQRFLDRFSLIEMALEGKLSEYSFSELKQHWQTAKLKLKKKN